MTLTRGSSSTLEKVDKDVKEEDDDDDEDQNSFFFLNFPKSKPMTT
jgi:hypothetical protein